MVKEVGKAIRAAGQLLEVRDTFFSIGQWPDKPRRPHA